ncbi:MAG: DUF3822 family protein [Flavobacteriaceae bacterium]
MIENKINTIEVKTTEDFHKLSIQVSLNGLSFCILDTIANSIVLSQSAVFDKQLTPLEVQKKLQSLFEKHDIVQRQFSEVLVIHKNEFFNLVPKALFDAGELPNYLKFNTRLLTNDHIVFDEISSYDIVNVYVPFTNINNYIFDLFGEFEFQHTATIMIHTLLNSKLNGEKPVCYVYVTPNEMAITVISHKKLIVYNSYNFNTREDFIYYVLFTLEQLQLDTENTALKLFGAIEEGDEIYDICYKYVKQVSIFIPSNPAYPILNIDRDSIDFTMLSTL